MMPIPLGPLGPLQYIHGSYTLARESDPSIYLSIYLSIYTLVYVCCSHFFPQSETQTRSQSILNSVGRNLDRSYSVV